MMKIKLNDGKTGDVSYETAQHMIAAGHATEVKSETKKSESGQKSSAANKS